MGGYYVGLRSWWGYVGWNNYQEPCKHVQIKDLKILNQCEENFSHAQGLSETRDTIIGGACIVAGGLSELTKQYPYHIQFLPEKR